MLLILQEAVALRNAALPDQVEKLELAEGFADLLDLFVIEGEGQSSNVQLVVLADRLEVVPFQVLLLQELPRTHDFERCPLQIVELGVRPEEIFHPPRRQRHYRKGFCLLKLHVFYRQWHREFGVGSCDDGVEVLEELFEGDFEGEVGAYDFEGVVLGDGEDALLVG